MKKALILLIMAIFFISLFAGNVFAQEESFLDPLYKTLHPIFDAVDTAKLTRSFDADRKAQFYVRFMLFILLFAALYYALRFVFKDQPKIGGTIAAVVALIGVIGIPSGFLRTIVITYSFVFGVLILAVPLGGAAWIAHRVKSSFGPGAGSRAVCALTYLLFVVVLAQINNENVFAEFGIEKAAMTWLGWLNLVMLVLMILFIVNLFGIFAGPGSLTSRQTGPMVGAGLEKLGGLTKRFTKEGAQERAYENMKKRLLEQDEKISNKVIEIEEEVKNLDAALINDLEESKQILAKIEQRSTELFNLRRQLETIRTEIEGKAMSPEHKSELMAKYNEILGRFRTTVESIKSLKDRKDQLDNLTIKNLEEQLEKTRKEYAEFQKESELEKRREAVDRRESALNKERIGIETQEETGEIKPVEAEKEKQRIGEEQAKLTQEMTTLQQEEKATMELEKLNQRKEELIREEQQGPD